jgi:hypothetical protein
LAGLVAPEQQDCLPSRVEREQDPQRSTLAGSKFLHVVMPEPTDPIDCGPTKVGTSAFEEIDSHTECSLLFDIEPLPPSLELVGELDDPHSASMSLCY